MPPLAPRAWLRWDVVRRTVDRLAPGTVFEIGCGQGAVGARLATRASYLGAEPDDTSFALADSRITPHGGVVMHGTHADADQEARYDLVCAFEVLEHIEADRSVLAEWVAFVRPGGHILLSVPAFQSRFGPMDVQAGHFRRYSPEQMRDLLAEVGIEQVEVTVFGWPLGYVLELVRNRIAARRIDAAPDASMAELTSASGRLMQPRARALGWVSRLGTWPFRKMQRLLPGKGVGLVVVGRKPA